MYEIAPGSILQRMYLKKRLGKKKYKSFCEIGSGNGYLSSILLHQGMKGIGYDLNESACKNNVEKNKEYIEKGNYHVIQGDFFSSDDNHKFDLIISSMVIEHFDDNIVDVYFEECKKRLCPRGSIMVFVPASMKYWGIEDEIAGHFRRYEFDDFNFISEKHNLIINDLVGLTYPISNWLFRLSNRLVKQNESNKIKLNKQEQTILSGNRNVKYKTAYPKWNKLFLNEVVLYPFHLMQLVSRKNTNSMAIFCELLVKN